MIVKTKFTKGEWSVFDKDEPEKPWHSQKVNNLVRMPASKKTKHGACIYSCLGGFDVHTQKDEVEANAHLIAAAPEMYAMLDEIAINMHKTDSGCIQDILAIEKLLKKARGE